MKSKLLMLSFLILLTGCDYDVPLGQSAVFPSDAGLAGLWNGTDSDGKPVTLDIQISGNDYTVAYEAGEDMLSFKGFEVREAGLRLIQLELQGAEKEKYLFVKYELTGSTLKIYRLNPEVVSAKCQTLQELSTDLKVHIDNPFLFDEPLTFTRSAAQ